MGREKTTVVSQNSQQTQYTPTAAETALNESNARTVLAAEPDQIAMNKNASNFINSLFTGNYAGLGNIFEPLARGTTEDVTSGIVGSSLRDLNAQLKKSGAGSFVESGPSQSIGTRTAGEIRQAAQQFDIGTILNLANLAVGGQASVQSPALSLSSQLGQRLAGLRNVQSSSLGNQATYGMNPFLKSLQQSGGRTLGSPSFGFGGNVPGGFQF